MDAQKIEALIEHWEVVEQKFRDKARESYEKGWKNDDALKSAVADQVQLCRIQLQEAAGLVAKG
jgi:hypothetical protein